ncbi:MAG: copper resistance CopC/CopD family protein [Actinomycetota bacterium]
MRRALVVLGLAAAGLVMTGPAAHAHALLQSSSPANGDVLDTAPPEIVITFTEPPDHGLSQIRVFDSTGAPVEVGPLEGVAGQPRGLRVSLPELSRGTYTVSWRVLSTADGHVTTGSFAFGVGQAVEPVAEPKGSYPTQERPTPLAVGSRWAFYWGLALLFGGALGRLLVFRARSPVPGLLWLAWAAAALGVLGMFLAERAAVDVPAAELLGSERGRLLVARGAVVLLALPATAASALRPRRWIAAILAAAAALAMLVHAFAGHASAVENAPLHVGVQWVHILSVAAWVGGLLWLLVGIRGEPDEERSGAVRRFSALATVALPVVAVTGVLRALNQVGLEPDRLIDTGFGLTVVGKSALFLGLLALGAYNRYRIVPRISSRGRLFGTLRRTVGAELAIGAGVFGLTGLMAGLPPPAQAPPPVAPARVVAEGSDPAGLLHVRLTATPGTAGVNRFDVRVTDGEGEPVDATGVRLSFSLPSRPDIAPSELDLESVGQAAWRAEGPNLSVDGSWEVDALVLLGGDSRTIDLGLRTRLPPQDITVSEAEGQPTIYTIALPNGISIQGFVDPGKEGPNEVHLTFLTPEGAEQPVEVARFEAAPETGAPLLLDPVVLSPGHFVAQEDLGAGRWTFRVEGSTPEGTPVDAYFREEIEG